MSDFIFHKFGKLSINKNLEWYHDQQKITNTNILDYFNQHIEKEGSRYCIQIKDNKVYVEVEDTPYQVKDINFDQVASTVIVTLSNNLLISLSSKAELVFESDNDIYFREKDLKIKVSQKIYNFIIPYLNLENTNYIIQCGDLKISVNYMDSEKI